MTLEWSLPITSALCFILTVSTAGGQTTWYVEDDGEAGNGCTSWSDACPDLQTALGLAVSGDQIWVAAGTYVGNFRLAWGVEVYGGFAGNETELSQRDWTANLTILDGNGTGSVVYSPRWATETTRIDGFTITNGSADRGGGGLYLWQSSPTIANNTITSSSAHLGGGLYLHSSSPTIAGNTIAGNSSGQYGGGLYLDYSSPTIAKNTIVGNEAYNWGGGLYMEWGSSPTIANNTITGNSAHVGGGLVVYRSWPAIVNNTITANRADYVGGGLYLYNSFSSLTIANNTIVGNEAHSGGGALCLRGSSPTIANNTITGNSAYYGGGLYLDSSSPTIANTIVAFNSSGIYRYGDGTPRVRYNSVYGNAEYDYSGLTDPTGTHGNISADPLFAQNPNPGPDSLWGTDDDDFGNLQLLSGSLCIDAGDNNGVPPDTPDLDGDSDTAEPFSLDLAGSARVQDDPRTPDTGNPGVAGPPIVDMGAYELQVCGNGVVDPGEECEPPGSECCDAWCHFVFFVFGACCFDHVICVDNTECYECGLVGGRFLGRDLTCDGDPDGDGAFGCEDGCPVDPYKTEPGICGCGIPDDDTDGDAVPDCIDLCPDTPVGVPVNSHGCPALGACCFLVGVCWDKLQPDDCAFIGGTYQGDGSTCYIGCLLPGRGDADGDSAVDLDDFVFWAECATDPYHDRYPEACEPLDFNWDGDVDMADFARFQVAFSSVFCQIDADCDDGLFCNGDEVCDTQDGCISAGDPCPPDTFCNEDTDTCDECQGDADCDDDVDCTDDACVSGTCVFTENNANCPDDGLFCNGNEVCDGANDCVSTGDPCPAGTTCNEDTDNCDECQTAAECDDEVNCTDDTCVSGRCVFTANDVNCSDNGLFCDGLEYCNPVSDCTSSGSPCQPDEICNEEADRCEVEPATWVSTQLLLSGSPGYKAPERYELDDVRDLVVAHFGLSEATLRETWPDATIEIFATDVLPGVETDMYRVVDDPVGSFEVTIVQTVTINTFHLSFRGSTATWEFDYTVVSDVDNPIGHSVNSGHFTGEQTGEITGAQGEITWTEVDGTFQRCEVGGECQTPTPLDWMLGTWTKE